MSETQICSKCKLEKDISRFRKGRRKCIDCINVMRRATNQRKMLIEQAILRGEILPEEYGSEMKNLWYEENRERLSKADQIKYIENRENRLENAKKNYYDETKIVSNLIRNTKQRAKTSEMEFNLDKEFVENIYKEQNGFCAVSGIKFIFDKNEKATRRPFAPSIDRINSELGYVKGNVRLVCVVVNMSLNEFGDEVFDQMCEAYIRKKYKDNIE